MDIKYVWSGSDAKALAYYVTDYITKSDLSFHDSLALLVKATKDFNKNQVNSSDNIHERSRRLLLRMHNTLASQQELSGVQVASYILNLPDHYTTHEFKKIYLIAIESYLEKCLHEKKVQLARESTIIESNYLFHIFLMQTCVFFVVADQVDVNMDSEDDVDGAIDEQFLIEPSHGNKMVLINTRIDYQQRDNTLDDLCLYDYVSWYKKKKIDGNDRKILERNSRENVVPQRGRPINDRCRFLREHPQYLSHILMRWTQPRVPVLVGPMIPRRERDDTKERYYRAILTLFIPWRSISDLCNVTQSWEQAYVSKQNLITVDMRRIIENIQLLHECRKDRDDHLLQIIQENNPDDIDPRLSQQLPTNGDHDDDMEEVDDILNMIAHVDDNVRMIDAATVATTHETVYLNELLAAISNVHRFPHLKSKTYRLFFPR